MKCGDSGIAIAVRFRSVHDASGSGEGFCRSHAVKSAVVSGGVQVKSNVQPCSYLWWDDEYRGANRRIAQHGGDMRVVFHRDEWAFGGACALAVTNVEYIWRGNVFCGKQKAVIEYRGVRSRNAGIPAVCCG